MCWRSGISSTAFGVVFDRAGIAKGISRVSCYIFGCILYSVQILLSGVPLIPVLESSWSTSGSTARGTFYRQEYSNYHRRGEGYILQVGYRIHVSSSKVSRGV